MSPNPSLIHSRVWRLAGPMILSNLSVPLLGLVDTAVMGHLSDAYYLGAVAVGALIFSFVFWGFGFLRMGTTGLTAQAHGREDYDELRAVLARAVVLALGLAALVLVLQGPIVWLAFTLIDASAEVERYGAEYFSIRIWSAPAVLINYAMIGWFLGMQRAQGPLVLLLVINVTNILLDLWFVPGLGMTADGVALASVIAEYLGVVVGLYLVHRYLKPYPGSWRGIQLWHWPRLREMLVLNQNIFIRTLCLIFSFGFFTAQGAKHGDVVLAANALLMNFQTFMAYGLDGFAHAAEALVGRAVGQKRRDEWRSAVYTTGVWSLWVAAAFCLIYWLAGEQIIAMLTNIEEVRLLAQEYLIWLILAPLISVWSYWFDGIFIGATRSREMRNTMLVSTLVFFLPAWYLLQPWGNHGLWAALMVFMAARGITMYLSYRRFQGQVL